MGKPMSVKNTVLLIIKNKEGDHLHAILDALDNREISIDEGVLRTYLSQLKGSGYIAMEKATRCPHCKRKMNTYSITQKGLIKLS